MHRFDYDPADITAVILAGGRARRMGGQDKGLIPLNGRPLVEHVSGRLAGQVGRVLLNANRSLQQYRQLGFEVHTDVMPGFGGPLVGVLTGIQQAATDWIVFSPCDTPALPEDLVQRLWRAAQRNRTCLAVAYDGEAMQWLNCLLHREVEYSLLQALAGGESSMKGWVKRMDYAVADFTGEQQTFINVNTAEDLARCALGFTDKAQTAGRDW